METTRVLPNHHDTSTHLLNPSPNNSLRQHTTVPAYIEDSGKTNKAITWEHKSNPTNAAQSNVANQTVSAQPSIFEKMANILRPGIQSISRALLDPKNDVAAVTRLKRSMPDVPMSAILGGIANAYPAGINSPQYQFVLATINSSPMLLANIQAFPTPIRLTDQPSNEIGSPLSISKQELDQAYQLSQISMAPSNLGKVKLLAKLAHEFGRTEYASGNLPLAKTFENRAKAWVNSLPSPTQGLNGFNAQLFADDLVTTNLTGEAFAAIKAWNTVIDTTKTVDPAQYVSIVNSTIKTNHNGTISPTVENVHQRAQMFARESNYKNKYFFDGGGMALLASHARPGDIIRLSGYDANRIMAYGFIQKAGVMDTFIKI